MGFKRPCWIPSEHKGLLLATSLSDSVCRLRSIRSQLVKIARAGVIPTLPPTAVTTLGCCWVLVLDTGIRTGIENMIIRLDTIMEFGGLRGE